MCAAAAKSLQSCPTLQLHRRQPTRLLRPWDFPGKSTGVNCHCLLRLMRAWATNSSILGLSLVAQLVKNLPAMQKTCLGLIPGLGRSPGERNGNPLQCSCLENPRDRGDWWAAVYGVAQSRTRLK